MLLSSLVVNIATAAVTGLVMSLTTKLGNNLIGQ